MPSFAVQGHSAAVNVFNRCGAGSQDGTPTVCTDGNKGEVSKTNPIIDIVKIIIKVLSYVIGVAAVIGIIVSGLRFITANGDSNAVNTARSGLIYSLIGIAVVVFAQVIVAFVLNKLS